jgi:four helix bundle protein
VATGNFKELIVWQKSIALVKEIYVLTKIFPPEEKFGLISQIRRCAVSIPSNIAEGQARRTTGDFIRFISNAEGSLAECETQLILSVELGFCSQTGAETGFGLMLEIRKMLNALRRTLTAKASRT